MPEIWFEDVAGYEFYVTSNDGGHGVHFHSDVTTSTFGRVCALRQCSIAAAGDPALYTMRKSREMAEVIVHIASNANRSLSNTPMRIAPVESDSFPSFHNAHCLAVGYRFSGMKRQRCHVIV